MDEKDDVTQGETTQAPDARRSPYVRPATPHRRVASIDDLQADDSMADYSHDSDYTIGSRSPIPGRGYRRSRNEMPQLREELHYGQYLSVPKGRTDIFYARDRKRRARTAMLVIAIVAVVAIAIAAVWKLTGH